MVPDQNTGKRLAAFTVTAAASQTAFSKMQWCMAFGQRPRRIKSVSSISLLFSWKQGGPVAAPISCIVCEIRDTSSSGVLLPWAVNSSVSTLPIISGHDFPTRYLSVAFLRRKLGQLTEVSWSIMASGAILALKAREIKRLTPSVNPLHPPVDPVVIKVSIMPFWSEFTVMYILPQPVFTCSVTPMVFLGLGRGKVLFSEVVPPVFGCRFATPLLLCCQTGRQ
jgi:hypothetical protein